MPGTSRPTSTRLWPWAAAVAVGLTLAWGAGHHKPQQANADIVPEETTELAQAPAPRQPSAIVATAQTAAGEVRTSAATRPSPPRPAAIISLAAALSQVDPAATASPYAGSRKTSPTTFRVPLSHDLNATDGARAAGATKTSLPVTRALVLKGSEGVRSGGASIFQAILVPTDALSGDDTEIVDVSVDGMLAQRVRLRAGGAPIALSFTGGQAHTITITGVQEGLRFHDICLDIESPNGRVPSRGMHSGQSRTFPVEIQP